MYAVYKVAAAGATINQILSDFARILTGTTDKTTLSASCDQAGTSILTTYAAAGWTEYDSVGGATPTKKILSAPTLEGGQTKLFELSVSGTSMLARAWESWNTATDTGTNGSYNSSLLATAATAASIYQIYATARCIMIWKGNCTDLIGCIEFDRTAWPSQSVANGFVPFGVVWHSSGTITLFFNQQIGFSTPRHYGRDGTLLAGNPTQTYIAPYSPNPPATIYVAPQVMAYGSRNASNQEVAPVIKLGVCSSFNQIGLDGGEISTLTGIVWTKAGAAFDEFSYDSKTYICMPSPGGMSYGGFAFPKG